MSQAEAPTCDDVYRYIIEELDEHLDEPSRRAIKEHLEYCHDCSAVLRSLKRTVRYYRSVPEESVPDELQNRVFKIVKKSAQKGGMDKNHSHS